MTSLTTSVIMLSCNIGNKSNTLSFGDLDRNDKQSYTDFNFETNLHTQGIR